MSANNMLDLCGKLIKLNLKVLKKSYGEGNGNPLQCSCLENPVDRGIWRTTVRGIAESDTAEAI